MVWPFINSLLIGQILMLIFGLYIARLAAHVVRIPLHILASAVLVLAVYGAYSVENSISSVFVMFALGLAMYFLAKFGFSAAPIVLGIILGPIAESNYHQGRLVAEAGDGMAVYFLTGPLNMLLIGLSVASIGYSLFMEIRARRLATTGEGAAA